MRRSAIIMAAGYLVCSGAAASAETVDINSVFGQFGFKEDKNLSSNSCRVVAEINQHEFIKSVPKLQKIGLLNTEISQTMMNTKPITLSMAFAMQMMPAVIPDAFEDVKTSDTCMFTQNIISVDEYGNDSKTKIFSFKFTRALSRKVNWNKFEPRNLIKIAPDFKFSPDIIAAIQSEQD